MNDPQTPHPIELCFQQTLERAEEYVRREPAKVVGAALGAGLLLSILPARSMKRPIASLGSLLLSPALIGLGLIKVFEICCQTTPCKEAHPRHRHPTP
ncbi:hypothetical protein [Prosthecobacter sp.]|uniref:hypothetical protein n=1 Tax=Prosthecobacter sp. TaxID=1965333 RepID=UPI00378458B1